MFPSTRKKWNKRLIETLKAISPRPTYLDNVKVKNKTTGKEEVKVVRKVLSNKDITKLATSNYNLSSGKDKESKDKTVPTVQEATVES